MTYEPDLEHGDKTKAQAALEQMFAYYTPVATKQPPATWYEDTPAR